MTTKLLLLVTLVSAFIASSLTAQDVRVEKDLLGQKEIPASAYYGVQTARALENFQISGVNINHYPGFVEAWAIVKLAAARANTDVGAMKPEKLAAIDKATQAVLAGKYHDQFLVDWYQGGAGTSTNRKVSRDSASVMTRVPSRLSVSSSSRVGNSAPSGPRRPMASGISIGNFSVWPGVAGTFWAMLSS